MPESGLQKPCWYEIKDLIDYLTILCKILRERQIFLYQFSAFNESRGQAQSKLPSRQFGFNKQLMLSTESNIKMTPTVFRKHGYRFFFFSREETRMHVHVVSAQGEAKFWLKPELELATNYRFSRKDLKEIEAIIEEHYHELTSAWIKHFSS